MASRRAWLAVVSELVARELARTKWHELRVVGPSSPPAPGDRLLVVLTRRLRPIDTATVIGTADVHDAHDDGDLSIRHRIVAPAEHEPRLAELRGILGVVGWTDDRLRGRIGSLEPLAPREFERAEAALREAALAFGPPPKRKMHARPRTPGRRAGASARVAATQAKARSAKNR